MKTTVDYRPEVVRQLRLIGCVVITVLPNGAEKWSSPRADRPFIVDTTVRSLKVANDILKQAGSSAIIRPMRQA